MISSIEFLSAGSDDIEYALFKTSLGIYLNRGQSAEGGHGHHVRAINTIRKAGGIRKAVNKGILKSGVMYACVKNNIPFILAGSIRDDGPLPEVITDAGFSITISGVASPPLFWTKDSSPVNPSFFSSSCILTT